MESTVFLIFWLSWSIWFPCDIPSFVDRSRDSAENTVMLLCGSVFVISVGGIRKSNYSQRSCKWPELKFHWLWLEPSRQLVESLNITNCWWSCLWSTSGKLVATLKLCCTLQPIYLSQKAPVPCMHCRCTAEIFFRVSFHWDLLQFINSLLLANFNARSWLTILRPANSLSREGQIIPVFRTNLEIFLSLARTRCSISVPPSPKRSSTTRLIIPATDFPVAGLLAMGSSILSYALHLLLSAHTVYLRCCLYHATV